MKRSTYQIVTILTVAGSLISTVASAQSARETLSKEAPNAIKWVLAGLNENIPSNIRQNLTYLREDLLDEAVANPKANPETYEYGRQLCNTLIQALDEHESTSVRAGYRAAQANANTEVTSQALEARRNYKMSWPQYAREEDQRDELQRQESNKVNLIKESVNVEWAKRVTALRGRIDRVYIKYRHALRNDPTFQISESAPTSPTNQELTPINPAPNATTFQTIAPAKALIGRFYVGVNKSAMIYVNGEKMHTTIGNSFSEEVSISGGDLIVISLENVAGSQFFRLAFMTSDRSRIVDFEARDYKEFPIQPITDITQESFDQAKMRVDSVKIIKDPLLPESIKCKSDAVWGGTRKKCILAARITNKMISSVPSTGNR